MKADTDMAGALVTPTIPTGILVLRAVVRRLGPQMRSLFFWGEAFQFERDLRGGFEFRNDVEDRNSREGRMRARGL